MLTWITFPCYVIFFSLLIYFIGYKLRAGESEWNDLHLVDVLPVGQKTELRGRTYSSVYSPANQRYDLQSSERFATFRGELIGGWGNVQSSERATITQKDDGYKAEVFVPVWTSQLFVSDWWQPGETPLELSITRQGDGWLLKAQNRTERKLTHLHLAVDDTLITLGDLAPNENKTFTLLRSQGTTLKEFVGTQGQHFQGAVTSRQHAFGSTERGRLDDLPNGTVAASFLSQMARHANQPYFTDFLSPPGLDMSSVLEHGNAVVFAWDGGFAPVKKTYQFTPRRSQTDTLWRIPLAIH
jgi:hypothetical protein